MPISHKHLLEKYIDHITQFTGIDCVQVILKDEVRKIAIGRLLDGESNVVFTPAEVEFFERTQRMLDSESDGV